MSKVKYVKHSVTVSQQNSIDKEQWLSSSEAKKALKISDCELMHLRTSGKLKFMKKGNAFFYLLESIHGN